MRKHNKSNSIKSIGRRGAAWLLALALMCGLMPGAGLSALAVQAPGTGNQAEYGHWAQEYLDKLVSWGVMRGDIDGNLRPDADISRAEFVTMVNRAYGYDEVGVNPFTDVDFHSWYADDISIAYNVGYFTGTSSTTASPDLGLTREQATLLLGRNMMLEASTGETLGYADSREFSDWSRAMIPAASNAGIINGYSDGTFRPQNNITRGEVAAMLARSLGTPIYEAGEYELGNVYGNVTIATSGVNLRNTVIAGDLYLTGGIGLGELLLENVTVLGRIIASGAGESNKGDSSIILRNVEADSMVVDSINNQFVTLRVEGDTDIDVTSVRTPAYLEDVTPDEYGLKLVQLEGEAGTSLQLAGNVKEVVNLTPNSYLHMAQGSAQRVTIDEKAMGATMQIDLGARVKELNLDVATTVTGTGDVDHVNISAAGCTVAMPPDTVDIRPGISSSVAGEAMDNVTAAEYSADPRILAGYPEARNVAPTGADAVFSTNKRGTVYWAITALADGSVSEDDLITPPVYGGIILQSGTLQAAASKTEYTAKLNKLTADGSYYLSAIMVDSRGQHSPVKVTAFTTPDDTVPAFTTGYPVMSRIQSDSAQVTIMTNKNCQLYWAVLPKGGTAPKPQDFKTGSISGNLGYGTLDAVKNSTMPFKVNNTPLDEMGEYDLYLWLTDYDGAKSSNVKKVSFKTVDGTPPVVRSIEQTGAAAKSVTMTFQINEPADLYWAVVKANEDFLRPVTAGGAKPGMSDLAAKTQVEAGIGAVKNGKATASKADTNATFTISGLEEMTSYDLYYVAKDKAGNYSEVVGKITVNTQDNQPPTVIQEFTEFGGEDNTKDPLPNTDIRLVFSESIQGFDLVNGVRDNYQSFLEVYQATRADKFAWALFLKDHIKLWRVDRETGGSSLAKDRWERKGENQWEEQDVWEIDYCNASVSIEDGKVVVIFPTSAGGLDLESGATYYFRLENIADMAMKPNPMRNQDLPRFTTMFAQVNLTKVSPSGTAGTDNPPKFDMTFRATPRAASSVEDGIEWDVLLWSQTTIKFEVWRRKVGTETWNKAPGVGSISTAAQQPRMGYSVTRCFAGNTASASWNFETLNKFETAYEYGIVITEIKENPERDTWNDTVKIDVSVVAGERVPLRDLASQVSPTNFTTQKENGVVEIGIPTNFSVDHPFSDTAAPYFTGGYPEFRPKDTSVEIDIRLNRSNNVYYYYVVAPRGIVPTTYKDKAINDTTSWETLPEDGKVLLDADGEPLKDKELEKFFATLPLANEVINPTYDNPYVITGSGKYNGGAIPLVNEKLSKELLANTEYIAYFVLTGESVETRSGVYCFRFKTIPLIRPVLDLQISNADSSQVDATVDRTADVQARLLFMGSIEAPFNEPFEKYAEAWKGEGDPPWKDNTSYRVIDAMKNSTGSNKTPSMFDEYASIELKNTVANAIRMGSSGGLNMWGPQTIPMDETRTMKFDLSDPDSTYVCIAVAKCNQEGAEDAFRAAWPVEYVDKVPPKAANASLDLVVNEDTNGRKTIEGMIMIDYDKYLYRVTNAGVRLPLAELKGTLLDKNGNDTASDPSKAEYYGIDNLFRSIGGGTTGVDWYEVLPSSGPPTRTTGFTIYVKNRPLSNSIEIPLPTVLYNKNGDRVPNQSVQITATFNASTNQYTFTAKIIDNKS